MATIDPERVAANMAQVRAEIERDDVQILAAVKYLEPTDLDALRLGGVTLVGENRAQELVRKKQIHGDAFTWDFIGHVQSRKVRQILPLVRWIHSISSESACRELARHGTPETEVLVEINIAEEPGKGGIPPADLSRFLELVPCRVVGLMTMPPVASKAEQSRRWFAALAQLAADHGLRELSMGTSQDYVVAAQEGATIVRIGNRLFE